MSNLKQKQLDLFPKSQLIHFDAALDSEFVDGIKRHLDKAGPYDRLAVFHPSTALPLLKRASPVWPATNEGSQPSARILSLSRSIKCVCCHREGNIVVAERIVHAATEQVHFNVYHVTPAEMVQMTADHILPSSYGGRDHHDNYQTMCQPCNVKKGNRLSLEDIEAIKANPTKHAKPWVSRSYLNAVLNVQRHVLTCSDGKLRASLLELLAKCNKQVTPHLPERQVNVVAKHLNDKATALITPQPPTTMTRTRKVPPTKWERFQLWVHMTLVKINAVL